MILLRHGQSEFNLHFTATRRDPGIKDPKLTPLGHQQAEAAAEAIPAAQEVRRIIASPYTRALETAAPLARRLGLPVLVQPLVRERYAFACDIGSPRTALALDWPALDFNHIDEVWWPAMEEPAEQVSARARLFRAEMSALADWEHTVVVSHWGFILAMTGQSVMNGQWLRCDPTAPEPAEISWKH
ncbi:phosphoglycerate mutase family protein [Roseomonas sp. GC11]|uniref:histidine phosphatase family protein n=1 Tax=Roseomonas sp. GC11 TaxID=2950546 RepID=UPI00210B5EFD|nr:histidine phosphatase family protein [Roseomonas sp. GC11]MCQ4160459.1 phosphoglycerate mutase family protein [Roseomonas sp. GC11]